MNELEMLALAMASFVGTHLLLSHPLRAPLIGRVGERGFLGLYSLVAFLTLGWTVFLAWRLPADAPRAIPDMALWHVGSVFMLIAAILLVGSLIRNPAMVNPAGAPTVPEEARGVYAVTRHPMMWSFILWAIVHATLWPTPKNLILCAGIGGLSLIGALGQDAKKKAIQRDSWPAWERRTSFIPFVALLTGKARWHAALPGIVPLVGGLALWLLASWLHPRFGGPVVGPWLWAG